MSDVDGLPEPVCYGIRNKVSGAIIGIVPNKVGSKPATSAEYTEQYEEVPLYAAQCRAKGAECDQLIPGYPCQSPGSCRENGCSAVERRDYWDKPAASVVDGLISRSPNGKSIIVKSGGRNVLVDFGDALWRYFNDKLTQPATDQDIAEDIAHDAAIDEHCEQQAIGGDDDARNT